MHHSGDATFPVSDLVGWYVMEIDTWWDVVAKPGNAKMDCTVGKKWVQKSRAAARSSLSVWWVDPYGSKINFHLLPCSAPVARVRAHYFYPCQGLTERMKGIYSCPRNWSLKSCPQACVAFLFTLGESSLIWMFTTRMDWQYARSWIWSEFA